MCKDGLCHKQTIKIHNDSNCQALYIYHLIVLSDLKYVEYTMKKFTALPPIMLTNMTVVVSLVHAVGSIRTLRCMVPEPGS